MRAKVAGRASGPGSRDAPPDASGAEACNVADAARVEDVLDLWAWSNTGRARLRGKKGAVETTVSVCSAGNAALLPDMSSATEPARRFDEPAKMETPINP